MLYLLIALAALITGIALTIQAMLIWLDVAAARMKTAKKTPTLRVRIAMPTQARRADRQAA